MTGARAAAGVCRAARAVCAAVLLGASGAGAVDVMYDVSARTSLRARSLYPGERALPGDLELVPSGELALLGGTSSRVSLQYHPSLLLRTSPGPTLLHRARFTAAYRWDRAVLALTADGSSGTADVSPLRQAEGALPGAVGEPQTLGLVPFVRGASFLALDANPSDRLSFALFGGYVVSGSPTTPPSVTLPLQWGPTGRVRLRGVLTRLDAALLEGQVHQARFATGQLQLLALATGAWERRLGRSVTLTVGGGAAFAREHLVFILGGPPPGDYQELLPVVSAALTWRVGLRGLQVSASGPGLTLNAPGEGLSLTASARLAPFADRFNGSVYERLEGRLAAEWRPAREWTATASTGLAIAVPMVSAQSADRLLFIEGGGAWEAKPWLTLALTARALMTEQPGRTPAQGQWAGTVSVMVRDHDAAAW